MRIRGARKSSALKEYQSLPADGADPAIGGVSFDQGHVRCHLAVLSVSRSDRSLDVSPVKALAKTVEIRKYTPCVYACSV